MERQIDLRMTDADDLNNPQCLVVPATIDVLSAQKTGFLFRWLDSGPVRHPWVARVEIMPKLPVAIYPGHDWLRVHMTEDPQVFSATSDAITGRALAAAALVDIPEEVGLCINCAAQQVQFSVHRDAGDASFASFSDAVGNMNCMTHSIPRKRILRRDNAPVLIMSQILTQLMSEI